MNCLFPFQNPSLPLEERVDDLTARLTLDEKISLIPTQQGAVERLGVGAYDIGAEGAHGFVDRGGKSTTFVQTLGLSSTWDRNLLRRIGNITSTEARVYYNRVKNNGLSLWSPTIDMERDPRWGRTEEGYGEDPYLAGELASELVRGIQGDHPFYIKASCAPKHFFANNNETNRGSCNCTIRPQLLYEYYLEPFRHVFAKAKPFSLMTSYNEVNGIPMIIHPLVKDLVWKEWGLEKYGHIVTDGGDMSATVTEHHYFETHAETIAAAFSACVTNMNDPPEIVIPAVQEALSLGLITEADLDMHVKAVLRVRFRFGHFDPPGVCPFDSYGSELMMSDEAAKTAREAAGKAVVLMKNESGSSGKPLLPVKPGTYKKIAVIGPLADTVMSDWYTGFPSYKVTPLDALREVYGADSVVYEDGWDIVSFETADGRKLGLDDKDRLVCAQTSALFKRESWGWGADTLFSVDRSRYLQTRDITDWNNPLRDENGKPLPQKAQYEISACAETTWSWFIYTLFNIIPSGSGGSVYLKTWNSMTVTAPAPEAVSAPLSSVCSAEASDNPPEFKMRVEKDGVAAAVKAARGCGIVFIFAGNNPVINGKEEMDRPDLALPAHQAKLIKAVREANPDTVLVFVSSYPYACADEKVHIPAILYTAHGIQECGHGISDVVSGSVSPAGRLSLTWYESASCLPDIMDYDILKNKMTYRYYQGKPLFPFGHGLSYASFVYSDLECPERLFTEKPAEISFTVTNMSSFTADEVPQLYTAADISYPVRPVKSLRGFDRITLAPGESRRISWVISPEDVSVYDTVRGRMCFQRGMCRILIGSSSADIRLASSLFMEGEVIPARDISKQVYAWSFDDSESCSLVCRRGSSLPALSALAGGGWAVYKNCTAAPEGSVFRAWVRADGRCSLEVRAGSLDGAVICSAELPNTGDNCAVPWKKLRPTWTQIEIPVRSGFSGCDLFLILRGKAAVYSFLFR